MTHTHISIQTHTLLWTVVAGAANARDELAIMTHVMQDKKTTEVAFTIAQTELDRTEGLYIEGKGRVEGIVSELCPYKERCLSPWSS